MQGLFSPHNSIQGVHDCTCDSIISLYDICAQRKPSLLPSVFCALSSYQLPWSVLHRPNSTVSPAKAGRLQQEVLTDKQDLACPYCSGYQNLFRENLLLLPESYTAGLSRSPHPKPACITSTTAGCLFCCMRIIRSHSENESIGAPNHPPGDSML